VVVGGPVVEVVVGRGVVEVVVGRGVVEVVVGRGVVEVVVGGGVVVNADIPFHVASKDEYVSVSEEKVTRRKPVVDVKTSSVFREFCVATNSSVEH
jgi:hypothetical protein